MVFTGPHTPETRQRIAESNRRNWEDPETRAAMEEMKAKAAAAVRAAMADPEVRAKISEANRITWAKRRAAKEGQMITNPIIIPGPAGTWTLHSAAACIGQFQSFREAQIALRSLLTPDEFARRFPQTDLTIRRESRDRPTPVGRGRPAGYAASA